MRRTSIWWLMKWLYLFYTRPTSCSDFYTTASVNHWSARINVASIVHCILPPGQYIIIYSLMVYSLWRGKQYLIIESLLSLETNTWSCTLEVSMLRTGLTTIGPIFPLGLRLRGPVLELSNLGSSSTHNNTLQLQNNWSRHLLRPALCMVTITLPRRWICYALYLHRFTH